MDVDEVLPAIEESDEPAPAPKVFMPGTHVLDKDEILEPDDSVYIMRHTMNVKWPCLSFDVLRDSLGDQRQRYPATAYLVAGTQADVAKNNEVSVYKLSSLHKTQKDGGEIARLPSKFPEVLIHWQRTLTRTMMTIQMMRISTKTPSWNFVPSPTTAVSIACVLNHSHLLNHFPKSPSHTIPPPGLKLARSTYGTFGLSSNHSTYQVTLRIKHGRRVQCSLSTPMGGQRDSPWTGRHLARRILRRYDC
jgi:hypothetical protein